MYCAVNHVADFVLCDAHRVLFHLSIIRAVAECLCCLLCLLKHNLTALQHVPWCLLKPSGRQRNASTLLIRCQDHGLEAVTHGKNLVHMFYALVADFTYVQQAHLPVSGGHKCTVFLHTLNSAVQNMSDFVGCGVLTCRNTCTLVARHRALIVLHARLAVFTWLRLRARPCRRHDSTIALPRRSCSRDAAIRLRQLRRKPRPPQLRRRPRNRRLPLLLRQQQGARPRRPCGRWSA
mmetsp:Transcript_16917/g.50712  ORF Transcript_16917/g.50712 Transcript_16917/m.50712 type:complete len:235 (+) Transcript_16917:1307-2011(+)